MPDGPLPKIDYAPPLPWHRRRRSRAVLTLAIVAMALAGRRYGPPAWRQIQVVYWQRQCMRFTMPADRIVYEVDPAGMANLLRTGGPGYTSAKELYWSGTGTTATISTRGLPAVCYEPSCYAGFTGCTKVDGGVVFMHEMVSKAGVRRLVVIRKDPIPWEIGRFDAWKDLSVEAYTPATWLTSPVAAPNWRFYSGPPDDRTPSPVCVYAGQADPADASHVIVRYRAWGQIHVVDGYLNAAGDDVDWQERAPPATGPTTRG